MKRTGFTLIEMLFANAIAALVLATLTSVMITSTSSAQKELRQLLLHSRVSETLRFIQDELRRASSVEVLATEQRLATELRFVYHIGSEYVHSVIKMDDKQQQLNYCSVKGNQLETVESCLRFYSIFDQSQIKVTTFTVQEIGASNHDYSSLIELSLTAQLVDQPKAFNLTTRLAARY